MTTLPETMEKEEAKLIRNAIRLWPSYSMPDGLDGQASELKMTLVSVDSDLAKFAIREYSFRNRICQSKGMMASQYGDWELIAKVVEEDIQRIPQILPKDELDMIDS